VLALLFTLVPACGLRPVQTTDGGGDASAGRPGAGAAGTGGMANAGTAGGAAGSTGTGASGTAGTGSGGAGSGGSGGTAGGAGSGGSAGASGTAGGAGKGGAPGPECTTAADCKLFSDCCTCAALPVGDTVASCPAICKQNQCEALHLPPAAVACVAGRCVAGFACDASKVICKIAVPNCQAGDVPSVDESGSCYTGDCVPAAECKSVTGCASCTKPDQACVSYATLTGNHHHCVTMPPACGGSANCDCLGPTTCVAPYRACGNLSGVKGVGCACPSCQ
jgi:hypothetical protein